MKFIDDYKEAKAGIAAALSDIRLATMFIEEHHGKPDPEIAVRFFKNLEKDVDRRTPARARAYRKTVKPFADKIARIIGSAYEPSIKSSLTAVEIPPRLVAMIESGEVTMDTVDEMAKEHGHDTTEDECEMLCILRAAIDHINSGK
jgi:hypothetical protein